MLDKLKKHSPETTQKGDLKCQRLESKIGRWIYKDVAQIYPFQGSEGILFIIGLVTWIGWHIWCAKWETNYHDEKIQQYGSSQNLKDAIDSD